MAALGVAAPSSGRAVLVCQTCPFVWEPAAVTADEFAALVRQGCPDCDGWVWLGEVIGPADRSRHSR
jgi:hypothetical protein